MGVDILARAMASGKGSGTSTLAVKVDHDTDEISLTKSGEPIADSGATLPKYGLSYDTATGGLTLTKDGQGIHGETVDLPPYGSPLKADAIAQMTDTDKVYVLTTDGHWYYYNGTAWTDGGVYNAVEVVTDKTLTVADTAADAKATGDKLYDLKTQIDDVNSALDGLDDLVGDSTMGTTATTVTGAVAEHESDISNLQAKKINQPLDEHNQPTNGTDGQLIRTKGDGTTEWADVGLPTDEQTADAVSAWLEEHPEATTTVQDASLTEAKFTDSLKLKTIKDYVTPEMYGAVGDGNADDSTAFENAVNSGKLVYCSKIYKITQKIQLKKGISGSGEIIFRGNGCFTASMGTTVSNIIVRTNAKFFDFMDADVRPQGGPNTDAMILFKDITIYCESGALTIFDIKSYTSGFFNIVFKNINFFGTCDKCININSDKTKRGSWISQINFIDCMFGIPLHVITAYNIDNILLQNCTTQADEHNATNLLYDFSNCKRVYIINCFDWDFSYGASAKLYRFTDCDGCAWIGNDRTINNFNNTLPEIMRMFPVFTMGYGYAPMIYNKANILNTTLQSGDETFFKNPTGYGTTISPIHSIESGASGRGLRVVSPGTYGAYSYDFVVNGEGKIKIRIRVPDPNTQDEQGRNKTMWSNWYTFTPDN